MAIAPPKTLCESNVIVHHDFVQFGIQHLRYMTILPTSVLK